MSKPKQVRLHVDALPLLEELQALLAERSYTPVSRSSTLRYAVTLAAWYVRKARANGQTEPALGCVAGGDQTTGFRARRHGRCGKLT